MTPEQWKAWFNQPQPAYSQAEHSIMMALYHEDMKRYEKEKPSDTGTEPTTA